jgi:hypothetical protein
MFNGFIKAKEEYNYMPVPFFFDNLPGMNCRVMVKPLVNNLFNHSKSNCSWIEATLAGSVLVASNGFAEFDKPGIVQSMGFHQDIVRLMDDDDYATERFSESVQYIRDNLLLSNVNKLRAEILDASL